MNWHYVNQGQQAGPVTEEELLALVREGKIQADTLVWREGLPNWIPFSQAGLSGSPPPQSAPPFAPPAALNPNEVVCAECGRIFPIDETISYGHARVCAACKPVFMQKLAEGAKINSGNPADLNYAGFWIRVGAKLIDGLILGIPFAVIMVIFFMAVGISSPAPGQPRGATETVAPFLTLFLQFGMIALQIGYQTFFIGKYGATPGKMACGLKVISPDGARISYGRAAGRAFAEMLSGMICYIGYLMVAFDDQKRGLHDHICNTRVVRK